MQIKYLYLIFTLGLIVSCGRKDESVEKPTPKVNVLELKTETVPIYKEYVGQVYGQKDIPIRARVEGFLEGIHFNEGTRVKKGDLLYTIDSQPFQAEVAAKESGVAEAKTKLVRAESDLNRIRPLAESNAVSKRDLDAAIAERDAAKASLNAAKANLKISQIQLGYCKIYSPIDGLIGKTEAREGEFVGKNPNPVILNSVSQISTVRVQFFLSESEYLHFAREFISKDNTSTLGAKGAVLELIFSDGTFHKEKGSIDFIDNNIDPTTGSIMLQASFPNSEKLIKPGQFTKVKALIENRENSILVPQQCVKEVQGDMLVFVVNKDGVVELRPIVRFATFKDYYIISEGLKAGEKIVLEGIQKLKVGMKIIPIVVSYKSKTEVK